MTKLGVKDGVCERWCVEVVKDGVRQSGVSKMVCERWCVKDGV